MKAFSLSGKRIVFFGPRTFGYENAIIRELESLGAEVTFHGQLPSDHPWVKAVFRLFPILASKYAERYFIAWSERHCPPTCDYVLVIKGEGLSPDFLLHLKKRYPTARFILHLWDSLSNCPHIREKFRCFDSFSSFDPDDCRINPQFKYRPLFYMDKYLVHDRVDAGEGIVFVGTLNGDRHRVINRLEQALQPPYGIKYFLFVRSRLELALRKLIDSSVRQINALHFIYKPLSAASISQLFGGCAAVLDIEHFNQTGLTMRTFEVIASGKKLITTNKKIAEHDFYDPARICVIDRSAPVIPEGFFEKQTPALSGDFIARYSLRGWIMDILNDQAAS